jgi:hypothetical protein
MQQILFDEKTLQYLKNLEPIHTGVINPDDDKQELIYKPIFYTKFWYADNSDPEIEEFEDIDLALDDMKYPGTNRSDNKDDEKTLEVYFKPYWFDSSNNDMYECDSKYMIIDSYEMEKTWNFKLKCENNEGTIGINTFSSTEDTAESLLDEIQKNIFKEIPKEIDGYKIEVPSKEYADKYNRIYILNKEDDTGDDPDYIDRISVEIRISDHTYNPSNTGRFSSPDAFISIEIANDNKTKDRWHGKHSFQYDGNADPDDIYDDIINELYAIIQENF